MINIEDLPPEIQKKVREQAKAEGHKEPEKTNEKEDKGETREQRITRAKAIDRANKSKTKEAAKSTLKRIYTAFTGGGKGGRSGRSGKPNPQGATKTPRGDIQAAVMRSGSQMHGGKADFSHAPDFDLGLGGSGSKGKSKNTNYSLNFGKWKL